MQVNGNIVAFILAAGFSSRMETFKPDQDPYRKRLGETG
jgi:CTP:molybdopterin cytidylyltransferase MocA